MARQIEVTVPDIGGYDDVPVIELLVAVGDHVAENQGLATLESEKATMEVPSSSAGVVRELRIRLGDRVSEGAVIAVLEVEEEGIAPAPAADAKPAPMPAARTARPDTDAKSAAPSAVAVTAAPAPASATGRKPDIECRLLVLGAGPGGYTAAFRAADLGLDTVLVERYANLGGVCLNVGCIPSKALLHAAAVIDEAQHAEDYGISFGAPTIQLDALRTYKEKVVGQLTRGLAGMARQRKVRTVQGTGRFVSPHEVEVQTGAGAQLIRFEQCIIAAGSQAVKLPDFPWGDPRIMDSTDALDLVDIPASLLVVGGGIIGLEMATVYRALGSAVTVVELGTQLMPGADTDLVKPLADRLKKQGVTVHLDVKAAGVEASDAGVRITFEAMQGGSPPDAQTYDRVLVAVGRSPNGAKLGAETAGVQVSERGFIPVDRQMRTNVPHIFAIGDIVGNPMLAHKATHEAK
ncbi:MAG: dihydrolipoyl dehydrogenase, partial [Lysobacter sp.]